MKRLLCVAAATILGTAAFAQYTRIWTQPAVPTPEVLDRVGLRLGWRAAVPVDGPRDGIATIQNLGDVVIVQSRRGAITAFDPSNGAAKWRAAVGLAYPVTHAVGYNDSFILVANGTRIFALDRATGKGLWDVDLTATPSSPPAADIDAFYVCLSNGRLSAYAFPVETAPKPGPPTKTANPSTSAQGRNVAPRPAAGGSAAAMQPTRTAPSGSGRSVTVSAGVDARSVTTAVQVTGGRTATTGDLNRASRGQMAVGGPRLIWDYQTNLRMSERPVLGEKQIFAIGTGAQAVFIDKNGSRPVEFTADAPFSAPLGHYGEIAYAGCANGSIYALDIGRRLTLWHTTINGAVTEKPIATDEDLYVASERGGLGRHVRTTGEMLWQNRTAVHYVASNPKFVYARDSLGQLLVIDRARGTTLSTLDVQGFTTALANPETDRVILAADDGQIVSLYDRAYPQALHQRNPPPPVLPAAVSIPGTVEPKPDTTPAEPKPETPPVPKPPGKPATPPAKPAPGAPMKPPASPPVTPPPPPPPATPPAPAPEK
jgi:outer membrane protein assembly factor BamB